MARKTVDVAAASTKKRGSVKVRCNCESSFQDLTYGAGIRIASLMINGKALARCTVCSSLHHNAVR